MALDERYVIASDLEQYFVDKTTGLPLSNGTLTFYRDNARNTAKPVYQLSGAPPNYSYTSMGAQITLSAVGTVQNSGGDNEVIYYFPYDAQGELDLYYVVVRDQNGIEQFTREAWPNVTSGNDPTQDQSGLQNQISNPTFTNVFMNNGLSTVLTVTSAANQIFSIGPNWDFVISGTGSVTIQRIAVTGNDGIPTSPPYVLDVNISSGITQCLLRQRFSTNSGLWASTANSSLFLSGSFVASNQLTGTAGLQMYYLESTGGSPVLIVDGTFQTAYQLVTGSTLDPIPSSHNTDSGTDGYIDIYLSFTQGTHIRISTVQVIPTASNTVNLNFYDTDSSNRNEAYQGDYYLPRLINKSVPSHLVGWDFILNPAQFGETVSLGAIGANKSAYAWDQTIVFQSANSGVTITRGTAGGIVINPAATTQAALIQYLPTETSRKILMDNISVFIRGYCASATTLNCIVSLWYTTDVSLPNVGSGTNNSLIATLDATGKPETFNGNWTEVTLKTGFEAKFTLTDEIQDLTFPYWAAENATVFQSATHFAIVIGTASIPASTISPSFLAVGLYSGDVANYPAPQTPDQVLRECQYYYEKSYEKPTLPGTSTVVGCKFSLGKLYNSQTDNLTETFTGELEIDFRCTKITSPFVVIYSTDGTVNTIRSSIKNGVGESGVVDVPISFWNSTLSQSKIILDSNQTNVISTGVNLPAAIAQQICHYTADARLGIV